MLLTAVGWPFKLAQYLHAIQLIAYEDFLLSPDTVTLKLLDDRTSERIVSGLYWMDIKILRVGIDVGSDQLLQKGQCIDRRNVFASKKGTRVCTSVSFGIP